MNAEPVWLTVKEAADYARVGPRTIYREVNAGRLRAARVGGRREVRLLQSWVCEWLEANAAGGPKPSPVRSAVA
jgi:excisionase family DNA binding protein